MAMTTGSGEVRRKDYEFAERDEVLAFVDAQSHGHLAFVRGDGSPGMVAVNFARVGEAIYFHGALEGEKAESLRREPRVTFMVDEGFSLIPSYFTGTELACPATQYYKAAVVHGRAVFVETRAEKALGLQALMTKLQPGGGYRPITGDDPVYVKSLDTVAVARIEIESLTAKFKFGQNLPNRKRAGVAAQLTERAAGKDLATVDAIRKVCPFDEAG